MLSRSPKIVFFIMVLATSGFTSKLLANSEKSTELKHVHSPKKEKEFDVASSGPVETYRIYLGKVKVDPNRSSHLNPRYPGVVQTVTKGVGDSVKNGEVLARIARNVGLKTYTLKSNLNGKIIQRKLAVGEFVDEERLAFSIANMNTMWVNITIRQGDLVFFSDGQEVIVLSRNDKSKHATGSIFYVSPVVDQHTLSATATIKISNTEGDWKPGQYVDCYVVKDQKNFEVTVAKNAVFKDANTHFVIKKDSDGHFQKQEIRIGISDLHNTHVIHGLKKRDVVSLNPKKIKIAEDHNEHAEKDGHDDESESHSEEDDEHQEHEH
jgi:membrane fusion protein, heavy metal efflux system